jgi:hypothetical protein
VWSAIVVGVTLVFWTIVYRFSDESAWYAIAYPLGLMMLFYIAIGAVARGNRVEWKERGYVSR